MSQLQVFQCPACGANLSYDGGPQITFNCEYCHASIVVPQELRPHADSAPAAEPAATEPYAPVALPGGMVITGPNLLLAVVGWLINQASAQTGMEIDKDPLASARIAQAADKAMRALKKQEVAAISLPFLTADSNGPKNFEIQLTRAMVDDVAHGTIKWTSTPPAKPKRLFGF
jgi:hypothetical protein